jgi:hypothetical protein
MKTVTAAQALADLKARKTVHHAHRGDRSVAFRLQENGHIESTYSDGVVHRDLREPDAQIMAECWLGEPTLSTDPTPPRTRTPKKKASIPLAPGWSIALRRDEVVPHDPGQGTPAMVCGPFGKSATYCFTSDTGWVLDPDGCEVDVPAFILRRIHAAEDDVNAYLIQVTDWLAAQR